MFIFSDNMDPFSRVRSYYIQGAPTRVVIGLIEQCPDWSELAFQERIVNEVLLRTYSKRIVYQPSVDSEKWPRSGLRVPLHSEIFRYVDAKRCRRNCIRRLSLVHCRFFGYGV